MSELELRETDAGTRLRLRVKAGARRSALLGYHAGALKVSVTAAPEKGRANRAVVRLVAGLLGIAPSAISLIAGHTSSDKLLLVPLSREVILERLSIAEKPGQ